MNQMPNRISDWDLMHTVLLLHKHELASIAMAMAETTHPQLLQEYQQSFGQVLQHQKAISQLMNQRGYYNPIQADPQALYAAAREVQTGLAQVGGPGAPPPGVTAAGVAAGTTAGYGQPTTGTGAVYGGTTPGYGQR